MNSKIITLDFETYYDKDYTLSKLTTEEYINHPKFEIIGVGIKDGNTPAAWASGSHEQLRCFLGQFDWSHRPGLAHNSLFDLSVLSWKMGFIPGFCLDTLSMSRPLNGVETNHSLGKLVSFYGLGTKGEEVHQAIGKHRNDFSANELARYGNYCINDCELTYKLFNKLSQDFPLEELELINLTLLMHIRPLLKLDSELLKTRLDEIQAEKNLLLLGLQQHLNCETLEQVRKKLCSNQQFAKILEELGVALPTKISATTGKPTLAFAKTDLGFIALEEHPLPLVQQLCAVRLGTKSTLEESRIERFISISERNQSTLPVPLKYAATSTLRWAGTDEINIQNLPSRDKKKITLKQSIKAPKGYKLVHVDSSAVEARTGAWWVGQDWMVEAFKAGRDVYCEFGKDIYHRIITKEDKKERFVSKECLSGETLVLCSRGWIPIIDVSIKDKLWDGQEWVCHQGLKEIGLRETQNICGIWSTPDHLVWSGIEWLEMSLVSDDENFLYQALDTAAGCLQSPDILELKRVGDFKHLLLNVIVDFLNIRWILTTSKTLNPQDAAFVGKWQERKNIIGNILKNSPIRLIEEDYFPESQRRIIAAIIQKIKLMLGMEGEVSKYVKNGERIEGLSYDTFKQFLDGITPNSIWIEKIITDITSQETLDLLPEVKTLLIEERFRNFKKKLFVYDLLSAGPRNRFTILSNKGPLIVHNSILSLQYGVGYLKLKNALKVKGEVDLEEQECRRIVYLYRSKNNCFPKVWKQCDQALKNLMCWPSDGSSFYLGKHQLIPVTPYGIKFPNGFYLRYSNLRMHRGQLIYDSRKGPVNIWGGVVMANINSALARIVVAGQLLKVAERYPLTLTVHDSGLFLVPDDKKELEEAVKFIYTIFSTPPSWATGLPLSCEIKVGDNYGHI